MGTDRLGAVAGIISAVAAVVSVPYWYSAQQEEEAAKKAASEAAAQEAKAKPAIEEVAAPKPVETQFVAMPAPQQAEVAKVEAPRPSFDCDKAFTWSEREVCGGDKELVQLDWTLNDAYREYTNGLSAEAKAAFRTNQIAWLERLNSCRRDNMPSLCLKSTIRERTLEMEALIGQ